MAEMSAKSYLPDCANCRPNDLLCTPGQMIAKLYEEYDNPSVVEDIFIIEETEGRSLKQLRKLKVWPLFTQGEIILRGLTTEEVESLGIGFFDFLDEDAQSPIERKSYGIADLCPIPHVFGEIPESNTTAS